MNTDDLSGNTVNDYLYLFEFAKKDIEICEEKILSKEDDIQRHKNELIYHYFCYSQIVCAFEKFLTDTKQDIGKQKSKLFKNKTQTNIVFHIGNSWKHDIDRDIFAFKSGFINIKIEEKQIKVENITITERVHNAEIEGEFLTTNFENKKAMPKNITERKLKNIFLKSYIEITDFIQEYTS